MLIIPPHSAGLPHLNREAGVLLHNITKTIILSLSHSSHEKQNHKNYVFLIRINEA